MPCDFTTVVWDEALARDCRALVRLALAEDTLGAGDVTTLAIVGAERRGAADIVARAAGVVCGLLTAPMVLSELGADAAFVPLLRDGDAVAPGSVVGRLEGSARDLLTAERTALDFLGRLSGVATWTRRFVEAAAQGSPACRLYDTRKTTPGWRRLEKYAVRCGGGWNHRTGLFDAVLIKDNHLALAGEEGLGPAEAVLRARRWLESRGAGEPAAGSMVVEVEVDSLTQLAAVLALPASLGPDIVLLDNMAPEQLREAVAMRDRLAPAVRLEASGGVRLETLPAIAASGVDRVSVGALTHAAPWLDLGLDWRLPGACGAEAGSA